jgi:multiple sugar transport system substrate-binding protein
MGKPFSEVMTVSKRELHMKRLFPAVIFLLLFVNGCNGFLQDSGTAVPPGTSVPTDTIFPTVEISVAPAGSPTPPGPVTLSLWVPPQFDPASGNPAADLLQARLDEFSKRRQGVNVEVRIKAEEGSGGLLDSLTTTSGAAPLALPDLIALPGPGLETAALKGLLHPFDELDAPLEDQDWYDYARQLAQIQGRTYGLPFAGDALALVYRPDVVTTAPHDWNAVLNNTAPLVFSAADPLALFTLLQYQANNGAVRDEQGRPFLDEDVLTEVLTFYQDAEQTGVMPYWLTQYQDDEQVWEAFLDKRADIAVTWASRYLGNLPAESAAAQIPTPEGAPYSIATGWVWAIPTHQPERQELSIDLAEFLTEGDFLGEWSQAAGFLPTRSGALEGWSEESVRALIEDIVLSARILPPVDILTSLGSPLQMATVDVLKQQSDPRTAAQRVNETLIGP